jgi:hypothetical protein
MGLFYNKEKCLAVFSGKVTGNWTLKAQTSFLLIMTLFPRIIQSQDDSRLYN